AVHAGLEDLGVTDHGGERRSQLVGHDGEELGLGAARGFGLVAGAAELIPDVAARLDGAVRGGHLVEDHGEPSVAARLIPDRRHDLTRGEWGPVRSGEAYVFGVAALRERGAEGVFDARRVRLGAREE